MNIEYKQDKNGALKKIVQSTKPDEWLSALVKFANEIVKHSACYQTQLRCLSDEELQMIDKTLMSPDIIALNNSIFFYKINSSELYSQTIHPEKLISVKTRLRRLYHFIELLQRFSSQILLQRGLKIEHDYLFHGDEIPQGINIDVKKVYQDLIIRMIKDWRLNHLSLQKEPIVPGKLGGISRAYKFWFNPISLIDTVMNFHAQVSSNCDKNNINQEFSGQLSLLYQHLTTTECLDLYGYFSNKDTNYLMRTLLASCRGYNIIQSAALSDQTKQGVYRVYTILNSIMNALREELKHRHIITVPYDHRIEDKTLKPGRRNLQALKRVIDIYCERQLKENERLKQLFALLEA